MNRSRSRKMEESDSEGGDSSSDEDYGDGKSWGANKKRKQASRNKQSSL